MDDDDDALRDGSAHDAINTGTRVTRPDVFQISSAYVRYRGKHT